MLDSSEEILVNKVVAASVNSAFEVSFAVSSAQEKSEKIIRQETILKIIGFSLKTIGWKQRYKTLSLDFYSINFNI